MDEAEGEAVGGGGGGGASQGGGRVELSEAETFPGMAPILVLVLVVVVVLLVCNRGGGNAVLCPTGSHRHVSLL